MSHPDTLIVELTRRETYALYAAAHAKPQPLLKADLLSAFHKIEEALGPAGPASSASEFPSALTDSADAGAAVTPSRRGW